MKNSIIDPIRDDLRDYFNEEQRLFNEKQKEEINKSSTPGYYAIKSSLFNDWIQNSSNQKEHFKSFNKSLDKISSKKKAMQQRINFRALDLDAKDSAIEDFLAIPDQLTLNVPSAKSYFAVDNDINKPNNTRNLSQVVDNDIQLKRMQPATIAKRVEIDKQAFSNHSKSKSTFKSDLSVRKNRIMSAIPKCKVI